MSSTTYTLLAYPGNINAQKALIAAKYGGITIDYPPFAMGTQNKTPEFLAKNPTGQVPVLDTPDGPVFESNAIAKYVARKGTDHGLYGANVYEASVIDQWVEFFRSRLEPHIADWIYPVLGYAQFHEEKYKAAKASIPGNLAILDKVIEKNKGFLVGNRVTLADIILFVSLSGSLKLIFDPAFIAPFPHLKAWAVKFAAEPNFKAVIGDFELCQKEKTPGEVKH